MVTEENIVVDFNRAGEPVYTYYDPELKVEVTGWEELGRCKVAIFDRNMNPVFSPRTIIIPRREGLLPHLVETMNQLLAKYGQKYHREEVKTEG